jgi:hypothetical protein
MSKLPFSSAFKSDRLLGRHALVPANIWRRNDNRWLAEIPSIGEYRTQGKENPKSYLTS